jgi:TRAP-type mannitol/chloroaromatic compound transport system substrate-binding protein
VARNLARSEGLQGAILARFEAEGVDTRQLAPALLATLEAAAESVLEAEAEANATFAQVYENQKAFATRYATWDRLAYPRSPAP